MMMDGQDGDAILCKVFNVRWEGNALTWFQQLKPSSIVLFTYLFEEFIKYHALQIQECKHFDSLFEVPKCNDEPLRSYVDKFKEEMLLVSDLDQ